MGRRDGGEVVGGTLRFTDVFGRRFCPRHVGGGTYILRIVGSPIYFNGAKLVDNNGRE